MNYWFILIPLLTAFTGWFVIRLSVKMIFRPIYPQKLLGYTWQGIIPRHNKSIAEKIGKYVASEFSSFGSIDKKISDPNNFEKVKPLIEMHIDDFLRNKLKEQMPMIGMFIGDKTINTLKVVFIKEIEELFPNVIQQLADNLKNDLNLEQLVSSKIAGLSPELIETLVYINIGKEINKAAWFGFAIGLVIGLIQLSIILVTK
ncbi:MAG: DUF445 domain-containing protein [Chitinophagaceae bacterium]